MLASLLGDLQNPRSLVIYRVHMHQHAPPMFQDLPMHCHDFLMCSSSIGNTHRPIGHVDHRFAYGRNMVYNRCCTCLHAPPGFLASPPCADNIARSNHATKTAADVIWHHRMTSSLYVSSHVSTSTSVLVHVAARHMMKSSALLLDPWPDPKTRNRPGPVSVDFDPGPVDFDFLR